MSTIYLCSFSSLFGFLVALVLVVYSTAFDCFLFIIPYPPASTVSSSLFWTHDYSQYWIMTCCTCRFLWDANFSSGHWYFPRMYFLYLLRTMVWYSRGPDNFFLPVLINWEFSEKILFCNHLTVVNTVLCTSIFL